MLKRNWVCYTAANSEDHNLIRFLYNIRSLFGVSPLRASDSLLGVATRYRLNIQWAADASFQIFTHASFTERSARVFSIPNSRTGGGLK
jgi:hypothetical protein